tara:strand:+ start:342 stop:890 length:549 start_codon:yes stop_codon:yes gene_type:complete
MTLTTINLAALGDTINLTTEVTGTLPAANGGTGVTTYSPGKLLQIQSTKNTTYKGITTNAFVTCMTVSITPTSASSTIFVSGAAFLSKAGTDTKAFQKVQRVVGGSVTATQELSDMTADNDSTVKNDVGGSAFQWYDSPATTSAVTYNFVVSSYANTNGVNFNDYNTASSYSSQITAMEIGA